MTIAEARYMTVVQSSLRRIADNLEKNQSYNPLVIEFSDTDGHTHIQRYESLDKRRNGSGYEYRVNGYIVEEDTYNAVKSILTERYGIYKATKED